MDVESWVERPACRCGNLRTTCVSPSAAHVQKRVEGASKIKVEEAAQPAAPPRQPAEAATPSSAQGAEAAGSGEKATAQQAAAGGAEQAKGDAAVDTGAGDGDQAKGTEGDADMARPGDAAGTVLANGHAGGGGPGVRLPSLEAHLLPAASCHAPLQCPLVPLLLMPTRHMRG
jgi:hypothetical protein